MGRTLRTTPEGYNITTDIASCNEVSCPSVNGITATTRIQISSPVSPTSTQYIDALGRTLRTSTVGFNGSEIYQDTHYNSLGQVFRTSLPYFANALPVYTTTTYDDLGRVSQVERPDTSVVNRSYRVDISQHLAITTTTETVLDHNGQVVNSKKQISRSHFTGDLHSTTDAVGTAEEVSTTFNYYGTGLPKTIHVNTEQVASFTYDAAGHRTLLSDANVGTINTQYTALGQVRWQQDSASNITTTAYDLLGRPTSEVTADGTASWFYDPANAIGGLDYSQFADSNTAYSTLTQLTYNAQSKLTDTDVTLNVPGYTRHYRQDLSYDGFGRLSTASYPSGVTLRQDYTALGYLQQVSNDANSEALSKTVTVNALGHVTEHAFGNGITTARHYDPKTGRLTGIDTQDISNNLLQNNTYQWQSDGLLTQRTNNIVSSKVETFTYDALNRLQDAITQAGGIGRTASTRYALNGNIESKTSSDGSDNISGYQYGNNAGPHAVSAVNINGIAHTLNYNANGAITHYHAATGDDRYISWTARGKPATITQGDSASDATPTARDEFAYGESGLRYYKKATWDDAGTHRTEHTFYVGNFEDIIPGNDPLYTRIEKTRLGDSIMHLRLTDATITTERFEYLHRDHLGSVEAVTDEDGNTLMSFAFEAFGARRKTDWTGLPDSAETQAMLDELHRHTSRGYTDHEHLDRTGLIHMNGRVYDPVIGRFLSPDPFVQAPGYSQSYNRYSYVWNNPLGMTDPTGYFGSAGGAADAAKTADEEVIVYGSAGEGGDFYGSRGGQHFALAGNNRAAENRNGARNNLGNQFRLSLSDFISGDFGQQVEANIARGVINSALEVASQQIIGVLIEVLAAAAGISVAEANQGKNEFDQFKDFLSEQGVDRKASEPFIHEKIAGSKNDLPESVLNFEPDGPWNWMTNADDKGNHIWNQRLPGGYHLTIDKGLEGVYVHQDYHDPTRSLSHALNHWRHEVSPGHDSIYQDNNSDWSR